MAKNTARTQPLLSPQNFSVSENEQLWEYLLADAFGMICLSPRAFKVFLYFVTSFPVEGLEEFAGEDHCSGPTGAAVKLNRPLSGVCRLLPDLVQNSSQAVSRLQKTSPGPGHRVARGMRTHRHMLLCFFR